MICQERQGISIHALLAESDPGKVRVVEPGLVFLSTLSLRRATASAGRLYIIYRDFYPRSPCGERPIMNNIIFMPREFLSTLSLRRATNARPETRRSCAISIHALLAESDSSIDDFEPSTTHFYPRSPCGERPPNQYRR